MLVRMVAIRRLVDEIPLPFDHFFFCFLPADAAAGAWEACKSVQYLLLLDSLTIFADVR